MRSGHGEVCEILHHGKIHVVFDEFLADLLGDGEQAVEAGYGSGHVRIVLASLCAVEHKSFDFVLEALHKLIWLVGAGDTCVQAMRTGPCGAWLLVVVVEQDARACAVHYTLHCTEHDTFLVAEVGGIEVKCAHHFGRWQKQWQKPVLRPVDLVIFEYPVVIGVEVVFGVGKSDFFHIGHIVEDYVAVSGVHKHGGLLCAEAHYAHGYGGKHKYISHVVEFLERLCGVMNFSHNRLSEGYFGGEGAYAHNVDACAESVGGEFQLAIGNGGSWHCASVDTAYFGFHAVGNGSEQGRSRLKHAHNAHLSVWYRQRCRGAKLEFGNVVYFYFHVVGCGFRCHDQFAV